MNITNQLREFAEGHRGEMSVNAYEFIGQMIQGMEHDAEENYYKLQLAKLLAIIESNNGVLTRGYVAEKLQRALNGSGIGVHPSLKHDIDMIMKRFGED